MAEPSGKIDFEVVKDATGLFKGNYSDVLMRQQFSTVSYFDYCFSSLLLEELAVFCDNSDCSPLCNVVWYCISFCCVVLYYIVSRRVVLSCIVLYCTV